MALSISVGICVNVFAAFTVSRADSAYRTQTFVFCYTAQLPPTFSLKAEIFYFSDLHQAIELLDRAM